MIKIPADGSNKTVEELQGRFYGEKEIRLLPPSILKALNRQPRNLFTQATSETDGGPTVALDFDVQSDYMVRQFN